MKTENSDGSFSEDDDVAAEASESTPSPEDGREGLDAYGDMLPGVLREALKKRGFSTLTSVQQAVVRARTDERDVRISSQTGSGKTVAVGVAIGRQLLGTGSRREQIARGENVKDRDPQVLLLTPTRELATQVQRELAWLFADVPDAFVEVVTGGTSVGMERKSLSRGPRVIVGTPGRVLDHLKSGGFSGQQVNQVILDEADQMLDMGFRDELEGILEQLPEQRRTHLVSATFGGEVLRIAQRFQKDPIYVEGSPLGVANQDIEHVAHVVSMRHRYDALVNILLSALARRDDGDPGRTLVFTRTRADTLEVAERLSKDGLRAESLSGDLAQAQRTRTLTGFRAGRISILVATDVAARGLDVQGVDLVVHFDPPGDPDAYTHRSGRTGRAGRKGTSILLLPPQARGRVERLLKAARIQPSFAPVPSADKVRKLYAKLGKRKLYAALEEPCPEERVEYARKMMAEHPPEQIIARLLSSMDEKPPCLPREITEHISSEYRGNKRSEAKGRRPNDARWDRPRFEGKRPFRDDRGGERGPDRGGERGPVRDGGRAPERTGDRDQRPDGERAPWIKKPGRGPHADRGKRPDDRRAGGPPGRKRPGPPKRRFR